MFDWLSERTRTGWGRKRTDCWRTSFFVSVWSTFFFKWHRKKWSVLPFSEGSRWPNLRQLSGARLILDDSIRGPAHQQATEISMFLLTQDTLLDHLYLLFSPPCFAIPSDPFRSRKQDLGREKRRYVRCAKVPKAKWEKRQKNRLRLREPVWFFWV